MDDSSSLPNCWLCHFVAESRDKLMQHILKSHLAASLGQAGSSSLSPDETKPDSSDKTVKLEPEDSASDEEYNPNIKLESGDVEGENSSDQEENAEYDNPNVKSEPEDMEEENCSDRDDDNEELLEALMNPQVEVSEAGGSEETSSPFEAEENKCKECGKVFAKRKSLMDHKRNIHNSRNLECHVCHKIMAGVKTLTHHLKTIHSNAEPEKVSSTKKPAPLKYNFECQICKKGMASRKTLAHHYEDVHELKHGNVEGEASFDAGVAGGDDDGSQIKIDCTVCFKTFANQNSLYGHMIDKHEEKTFECIFCPEKFSRMFLLRKHIKNTHDKSSSFPCPHCTKEFASYNTLYTHIRVLHKEKRFECKECQAYFGTKSELKEHEQNSHPKNDSFVCSLCPKIYYNKKHLRRHVSKVHLGVAPKPLERKRECEICGKKFQTNSHLKRHLTRVHSINETLSCQECHLIFSTDEMLSNHVIMVHSDDTIFNNDP